TLPITFVILLIAFGAFVAAVVPLVLAVTSLLGAFGVLALYSQTVSAISPYASQLVVLIGLAVAVDDPLFRSMAIGTIAVVLISVVGSLTFLPATLAILGDGVNRGRIPILGRERPEGSGIWATIVRAVMRRPVISFLVSG